MERYAPQPAVPFRRVGKLVIAVEPHELTALMALLDRATANGVPGLELVGPERIRELEPHAVGAQGLWSPTTGIMDFRRVAQVMAEDVRQRGGSIYVGRRVTGLRERAGGGVLERAAGAPHARHTHRAAG